MLDIFIAIDGTLFDLSPKADPTFGLGSQQGDRSQCPENISLEQIISKLQEAEVLFCQGKMMAAVCRGLNVTEQTEYHWWKGNGGVGAEQAHRIRELEKENARLRKLVADLSLDKAILQETLGATAKPGQAPSAQLLLPRTTGWQVSRATDVPEHIRTRQGYIRHPRR